MTHHCSCFNHREGQVQFPVQLKFIIYIKNKIPSHERLFSDDLGLNCLNLKFINNISISCHRKYIWPIKLLQTKLKNAPPLPKTNQTVRWGGGSVVGVRFAFIGQHHRVHGFKGGEGGVVPLPHPINLLSLIFLLHLYSLF